MRRPSGHRALLLQSLQHQPVALMRLLGEEAGDAGDGVVENAGLGADLAIGLAGIEQLRDPPALGQRIALARRGQVGEEARPSRPAVQPQPKASHKASEILFFLVCVHAHTRLSSPARLPRKRRYVTCRYSVLAR